MSASPSMPSGPPSTGPSTGVQAPRKRPPVSIFAAKKKPLRKPNPVTTSPNGVKSTAKSPVASSAANGSGSAAQQDKSDEGDYDEYSIYITKDAFMQGRHHHAMKLQARVGADGMPLEVNPYREDQFTRPLRLHRRSARDKKETAELSDAASGVDDKERELLDVRRAERQAEREANQALIAPTGGEAKQPVRKKPQKKVEDVYYDENDPRQRQRAQLRYEEARPWHLEDFDNKNIWVGSYEEPLSETSVLFELGTGGFRMVPVEKWYKFSQSNRVNIMDSDAVEKHMGKKYKPPRWFLGTQAANDEERKRNIMVQREIQRRNMRSVEDDDAPRAMKEEYRADVDEIDFEFNDEFQDDDEGMIFGDQQDDDAKEITRKIREEMREANLGGTGVKDEDRDWDEEEKEEQRAEQEEKKRTKRMRKQLIKKERKNEYDSDSEHGEFSEDSESEDSEEESERQELERKQEEARKNNGDKSGASTKGTNTPTGRLEKKDQTRLSTTLKRPGSPDLSELSGNESSRKKAKGLNGTAMSAAMAGSGRSLSPDAQGVRPKALRVGSAPGGYGSGSDTDASRGGSRAAGRHTSNHHHRGRKGSPGSPNEVTPAGSRAASPGVSPQRRASGFPTLDEVRAAIPPEGIGITDLVKFFRSRVQVRQADFIALVKEAGRQDAATKKIMRKAEGSA